MGEIDVTKVLAIDYLRKFIKIKEEELCTIACSDCKYNNVSCVRTQDIHNIGVQEYIKNVMEFELCEPKIDWAKVEKDTLIEVSENGKWWYKRYFAKYEDGKVYSYMDGCTSKTTRHTLPWKYARIADED